MPVRRGAVPIRGRSGVFAAMPLPRLPAFERTAHIAAMRVPAAGFRITRGAPKSYIGTADSGNAITRAFCGDCGSPLFVQVSTRPDIVGLRVGTLDDPSEFRPEADIFVKSAQPWEHLNPALPKFDTYPPGRSYLPDENPPRPLATSPLARGGRPVWRKLLTGCRRKGISRRSWGFEPTGLRAT